MTDISSIKENFNVIGADGVHLGTVERIEGERIKLKVESAPGIHEKHNHFISLGFVADIEGESVRLSANADVAVHFEEEQDGSEADL